MLTHPITGAAASSFTANWEVPHGGSLPLMPSTCAWYWALSSGIPDAAGIGTAPFLQAHLPGLDIKSLLTSSLTQAAASLTSDGNVTRLSAARAAHILTRPDETLPQWNFYQQCLCRCRDAHSQDSHDSSCSQFTTKPRLKRSLAFAWILTIMFCFVLVMLSSFLLWPSCNRQRNIRNQCQHN